MLPRGLSLRLPDAEPQLKRHLPTDGSPHSLSVLVPSQHHSPLPLSALFTCSISAPSASPPEQWQLWKSQGPLRLILSVYNSVRTALASHEHLSNDRTIEWAEQANASGVLKFPLWSSISSFVKKGENSSLAPFNHVLPAPDSILS